jgi:transcriptional regulator with XRE-family HTH domain
METMQKEKTITLTEDQFKHVDRSLGYGKRKLLAEKMGVSQAYLSKLLTRKQIYRPKNKRFVYECTLKESQFNQVMDFVNSLT